MWHLTQIPKIVHFYWATDTLPWIRYLSLKTFRQLNPDWEMILWKKEVLTRVDDPAISDGSCPPKPEGYVDWWPEVEKLGVKISILDVEKQFNFDMSYYKDCSVKDVHFSDFAYMGLLYEYGGLWVNMDMLFYKPIEQGVYNIPENNNFEVMGLQGVFNNFILAKHKANFMKDLFNLSVSVNHDEVQRNFSATGPITWEQNKNSSSYRHTLLELPLSITEYKWDDTEYYRKGEIGEFPNEVVAIHWHGGGHWNTHVNLTPENYKEDQSLIAKLVQRAL